VVDVLAQPQQAGAVADDQASAWARGATCDRRSKVVAAGVGGGRRGGGRVVAQGMGGETTPAPAGYPTLPDPTLIG
jgi:hypothetical protein